MSVTLHLGDCVKWAREYSGEPFHSLLTDPPYALGFMNKRWDNDVAFNPATWEAFGRILYPGAFGMAFASSRGWHRLAVAIEDAGFVIHPSMFGWAYGSGFPKATRVDTQIDREAGAEREVIRTSRQLIKDSYREMEGRTDRLSDTFDYTAPATPLAAAFAGHRYGLQALKPALEPIIVFQKPYAGRPIDNITATGAGCLAIDAARIGTDEDRSRPPRTPNAIYGGGNGTNLTASESHPAGRWPANFYLDAEAAARLDEQSGLTGQRVKGGYTPSAPKFNGRDYNNGQIYEGDKRLSRAPLDEPSGASRFFFTVREQLDDADPVRYVAKASRRERDAGLDTFPLKDKFTMDVGEGVMNRESREWDEVTARNVSQARNPHPTVKPLALARYLATLLLPPAEYAPRRLFVPFAGVASECIGAMQAGWEDVQGVELTEEYIPIAQARVEYWKSKGVQMEFK